MADAYLKYWRSQEHCDSGGALMNQGIHGVDMLIYVAGWIKSVIAKCATLARNIEWRI